MPGKKKSKGPLEARLAKGGKSQKSNKKFRFSKIAIQGKPAALLFLLLGLGALSFLLFRWLIIAWVDYMPVTRLTYLAQLEKRIDPTTGRPLGEEVKNQLITEILVINEAKKRNVFVTNEEIEKEYSRVSDQVGKDMLKNLLSQQNISELEFKKQLSLQLLVRKMFGKDVLVTDEELNKYLKENQGENTTPLTNKEKEDVKEQLMQQKISQNFRTWLQEAQRSSRVIRY